MKERVVHNVFTGIVRETGEIVGKESSPDGVTFRFRVGELHAGLDVGHSISVNGVCLTVTGIKGDCIEVDASPETLRRSNLGDKEIGDPVNLEPPLKLNDVLGGHLVQGHVDATGEVLDISRDGNSWVFRISLPEEVSRYCVMKGSITLDGISLTISGLGEDFMEVTIIPHTMEVTNMSEFRPGDKVNLEADVISKYVEKHTKNSLGITAADDSWDNGGFRD